MSSSNPGSIQGQLDRIWKALEDKQDSKMCTVLHENLSTEMTRLSSAIDGLTDKLENLVTVTWRIKLKMVVLFAMIASGSGGLTALVFNILERR